MDITFRTDLNARKMLYIYHGFSRLPREFQSAPMLFGNDFYKKHLLYKEMTEQNGAPNELFEMILEENSREKFHKTGKAKFFNSINRLKFPLKSSNDKLFIEIKKGVLAEFKKHQNEIAHYINKIFGLPAPEKLIVILSENLEAHSSSGYGIPSKYDNICIAGYVVGERAAQNHKITLSVLIHETIHSLLFKHKLINEKGAGSGEFVEAVLDYFVPDGMLASKLGLVKKQTVREYYNNSIKQRPYSKEISTKILPVMEEYNKQFARQTIWKFLSKKGFANFIK